MLSLLNIGLRRWLNHLGLALITLAGCYAAYRYAPFADLNYTLTIGCGYLALVLVVLTLVIGPVKLLWQRKNPVNLDLRRDVGIWAGITGCIHVFCGFREHMGGNIALYFLDPTPNGYRPLLNRFGISNDIGLIGVLILIVLLVLSNDISLKRLKGKRWKFLQRFNYLLAALIFIHTFLYQMISRREHPFMDVTLLLGLATLAIQTAGFMAYQTRQGGPKRLSRNAARPQN